MTLLLLPPVTNLKSYPPTILFPSLTILMPPSQHLISLLSPYKMPGPSWSQWYFWERCEYWWFKLSSSDNSRNQEASVNKSKQFKCMTWNCEGFKPLSLAPLKKCEAEFSYFIFLSEPWLSSQIFLSPQVSSPLSIATHWILMIKSTLIFLSPQTGLMLES